MKFSAVRRRAARRFMAGPQLEDALRREEELRGRGLKTVLGYWNGGDEDPDAVAATYQAAIDALAERPDVQYSCKVPALGLDPGRIEALAESTHRAGVPLHFDSLGPDVADAVLEAAVAARAGVTLPGRWSRSPADAEKLAPSDLPVRVIKGQWPDPITPRRDPRDGFLAVVARLAGRTAPVEVATHDGPLAAEALRVLRGAGRRASCSCCSACPRMDPSPLPARPGSTHGSSSPTACPTCPTGCEGSCGTPRSSCGCAPACSEPRPQRPSEQA